MARQRFTKLILMFVTRDRHGGCRLWAWVARAGVADAGSVGWRTQHQKLRRRSIATVVENTKVDVQPSTGPGEHWKVTCGTEGNAKFQPLITVRWRRSQQVRC